MILEGNPYITKDGSHLLPGEDKYCYLAFNEGAKAQLEKVVEWGNEICPHFIQLDPVENILKRECSDCWQALEDEVKEKL